MASCCGRPCANTCRRARSASRGELPDLDIRRPAGMPGTQKLRLYGGGVLIFDEYGRVKFHVSNRFKSARQTNY